MASVGSDRALSALTVILFGFALGTLSVVVPLLGVHAGYSNSEIGLLVAIAAVAQLVTRLFMGTLMRKIPDKSFLVGSGVMIAVSCTLLALSPVFMVFVLSQLFQGSARAFFWTSSQTHAVRTSTSAVSGLRDVNLAAGAGALLGPATAGYLWGFSVQLPLVVAAAAGFMALIPAALLVKLPPFATKPPYRASGGIRLWRRPGVNTACWMNAAAGGWKSVLDSYVPVALALAGQSAAAIGVLLSIANANIIVGSTLGGWVHDKGIRASLIMGVLGTGLGLAAVGPFATLVAPVAVALAVSGIGAGILQTVGPAIAAEEVDPEERGDSLALTGTFRAAALFLSPMGMAGLVALIPVSTALLAAGLLITTPAALALKSDRDGS
ncbi:MFS transporter [Citricoccus sp. I39-566]|uniref:MFS transporter n=1 Tax=Citricoccus sp. I39-566 TaxID=3073268 RepID=UPI00286B5A11|nr:MFS transporter [Citricoccus sp. I39-566]WMY79948.1 MFS transporter [Citricoccus sp. I39-566]